MVAINTATATSVPIASPAAPGHGTGPRGGRNTVASVPCTFMLDLAQPRRHRRRMTAETAGRAHGAPSER